MFNGVITAKPVFIELEKSQYEPRKNKLLRLFSEDDLSFMDEPFNVLVAGCGTGYGAIQYALTYDTHAHITAVDLSKASLAYATKMARKYGINNIRFLQKQLKSYGVIRVMGWATYDKTVCMDET